ncbi:MAG: hypothetical protein AAGD38_00080 [Acidobacteriota bacterium]
MRNAIRLLILASIFLLACAETPEPDANDVPQADESTVVDTNAVGESVDDHTTPEASQADDKSAPTSVVVAAERAITSGQPVTVRLPLDDTLVEAIMRHHNDTDTTLRLSLEGVQTPTAQASVRVFLNRPDATLDTPIDDPHYVGDVGFFPSGPEAAGDKNGFLLDLGTTLARFYPESRTRDGHLVLTLLAAPLLETATEGAPEIEIPIESVRLEVIEP